MGGQVSKTPGSPRQSTKRTAPVCVLRNSTILYLSATHEQLSGILILVMSVHVSRAVMIKSMLKDRGNEGIELKRLRTLLLKSQSSHFSH